MQARYRGFAHRLSLSGGLKLAALLIGIVIPVFMAHTIDEGRSQALRAAEIKAVNTTRALEQHAARTLETIDAYIRTVISLIGPDLDTLPSEVIHRALRDRLTDELHNIIVIDARGDVIHEGAAFPLRPRERRARDYFDALKNDAQAGLFVGKPIVGGASGKPTLPIARRINKPDGSFAGVIMAALDPAAFQSTYDTIELGKDSTLTLWRSDGMVLVRAPHVGELIGKSFASGENYQRYVLPKNTQPFWAAGSTDGMVRVISFGFLGEFPIYVSTALSRDTALEGWKRAAVTQASVAGVLTVLVMSSLLFTARQVRRRQLAQLAAHDSACATEATNLLLQTTLNTMDQGLIMVDERGVVQVYNRRALELLDLPADLLERRPTFSEVRQYQLAQGDFQRSDDTLRHWVETSGIESAHHVYERERPNGTILEIRTVPLASGGAVRTYSDVTERRLAGRAVRESEARYRLLADTSTDMVVQADADTTRRYVSPACRDLLGYEPEELIGTKPVDLVHPDDASTLSRALSELTTGERARTTSTHRFRRKDGSFVWVEADFHRLTDANGPGGYVAAVRNVEERQQQAEELRRAKEGMEALLQKAQDASRAKTDFLASMSHEIRTPLNSILGFTGLLLEGTDQAPEDRRKLELIQGSGSALLTVVNDILDFSKIEAGQIELEPRSFSLAGLIDNCVSIMRGVAVNKPVEIRSSLDSTLPPLLIGDQDRLRQVLLNLMNNAVKFTSQGYVEVAASAVERAGDQVSLQLRVTDTGIGIPRDKLPSLFERFTQVDGSISRRFGGTGLGLAISKQLIELMGGAISVESVEGKGSTFLFTVGLPVSAENVEEAGANGAPRTLASDCASTAIRPSRILLAEDLDINQELARTILEGAGHVVDVANNGAEAVQAVQRGAYDLVLMDVQMPVMDGMEATQRIRNLHGPVSKITIVAMTANVLPEQISRFRQAGMNDHVGKPFRRVELMSALARWLPNDGNESRAAQHEQGTGGFDEAAFAEMTGLLGGERMSRLLDQLDEHLRTALTPALETEADRAVLAARAHETVSVAGMLAFHELSDLCALLERACTSGEGVETLAVQVREACVRVLDEAIRLRSLVRNAA